MIHCALPAALATAPRGHKSYFKNPEAGVVPLRVTSPSRRFSKAVDNGNNDKNLREVCTIEHTGTLSFSKMMPFKSAEVHILGNANPISIINDSPQSLRLLQAMKSSCHVQGAHGLVTKVPSLLCSPLPEGACSSPERAGRIGIHPLIPRGFDPSRA
jgi:hypothetical protein